MGTTTTGVEVAVAAAAVEVAAVEAATAPATGMRSHVTSLGQGVGGGDSSVKDVSERLRELIEEEEEERQRRRSAEDRAT